MIPEGSIVIPCPLAAKTRSSGRYGRQARDINHWQRCRLLGLSAARPHPLDTTTYAGALQSQEHPGHPEQSILDGAEVAERKEQEGNVLWSGAREERRAQWKAYLQAL